MSKVLNIHRMACSVRACECPECGSVSIDEDSFLFNMNWIFEELMKHGCLDVSIQLGFQNPEWEEWHPSQNRWQYNMDMHDKHFGLVEKSYVSE